MDGRQRLEEMHNLEEIGQAINRMKSLIAAAKSATASALNPHGPNGMQENDGYYETSTGVSRGRPEPLMYGLRSDRTNLSNRSVNQPPAVFDRLAVKSPMNAGGSPAAGTPAYSKLKVREAYVPAVTERIQDALNKSTSKSNRLAQSVSPAPGKVPSQLAAKQHTLSSSTQVTRVGGATIHARLYQEARKQQEKQAAAKSPTPSTIATHAKAVKTAGWRPPPVTNAPIPAHSNVTKAKVPPGSVFDRLTSKARPAYIGSVASVAKDGGLSKPPAAKTATTKSAMLASSTVSTKSPQKVGATRTNAAATSTTAAGGAGGGFRKPTTAWMAKERSFAPESSMDLRSVTSGSMIDDQQTKNVNAHRRLSDAQASRTVERLMEYSKNREDRLQERRLEQERAEKAKAEQGRKHGAYRRGSLTSQSSSKFGNSVMSNSLLMGSSMNPAPMLDSGDDDHNQDAPQRLSRTNSLKNSRGTSPYEEQQQQQREQTKEEADRLYNEQSQARYEIDTDDDDVVTKPDVVITPGGSIQRKPSVAPTSMSVSHPRDHHDDDKAHDAKHAPMSHEDGQHATRSDGTAHHESQPKQSTASHDANAEQQDPSLASSDAVFKHHADLIVDSDRSHHQDDDSEAGSDISAPAPNSRLGTGRPEDVAAAEENKKAMMEDSDEDSFHDHESNQSEENQPMEDEENHHAEQDSHPPAAAPQAQVDDDPLSPDRPFVPPLRLRAMAHGWGKR